jgi:hypothetical protein
MTFTVRQLSFLVAFSVLASSSWAVDTKITGFAQVTAGRVLGGDPTDGQTSSTPYPLFGSTSKNNYQCPCFVGNYEYSGLYEFGKTQLGPESLAGIQGDFQFSPDWSATVQVVARGADNSANIDWAYGTYKVTPNLSVQFGRKRLPLYYYSDYMYVGYAYPWVRPNQDLYAWQIYSYDGANVVYKTSWNDWAIKSGAWVGSRADDNNSLLGNIYYGERIDERWKNMLGGYMTATNDVVEVRAVFFRTDIDRFKYPGGVQTLVMSGEGGTPVNNVAQNFYGLSFNVDHEGWILRTEVNIIDRPSVQNTYFAQSYSLGHQFGAHTVMASWSQFRESAAYWPDGTEKHSTTSLSYRWDFTRSQALKLQYDVMKDESKWLFTGSPQLLSASWNIVF